MILGYKQDNTPFTVKNLGIGGAITILLKDALLPNLVQTTENTPAFIHGGPFANIAHGCNSVMATKMAMSVCDYAVTEAGFGSDLGAEKFLNIKCRIADLAPKATVLVVTTQALKTHGGLEGEAAKNPNLEGLQRGLPNLERHLENLANFGQKVVVALNKFHFDTLEEIDFLRTWCQTHGILFAVNDAFTQGGDGAKEVAQKVLDIIEKYPPTVIQPTYDLQDSIEEKIEQIATQIYRAKSVEYSSKAATALQKIKKNNWTHLPVCIAKTQYSFTDDAKIIGAPINHVLHVTDLIICNGAGFVVAVAGDIMRMPGLPVEPAAHNMDIVDGVVYGLS